jgi:hypothetical protein
MNSDTKLDELRAEVVGFRREVRLWRAGLALCAVAVPAVWSIGWAGGSDEPANLVRAREIQLVNTKGGVVGRLATDLGGGGMFELKREDGTLIATALRGDFNQGGVAVGNEKGDAVAVLGSSPPGHGGLLQLVNKERVVLLATGGEDGGGQIILLGADGKRRHISCAGSKLEDANAPQSQAAKEPA